MKEMLIRMDPVEPEFNLMDWESIEALAGSPEMMMQLRKVPKLLPRTTHLMTRGAQAIMAHIGLHFTASGLTTRLVDNVQLPNIQGVSWFILFNLFTLITISTFV